MLWAFWGQLLREGDFPSRFPARDRRIVLEKKKKKEAWCLALHPIVLKLCSPFFALYWWSKHTQYSEIISHIPGIAWVILHTVLWTTVLHMTTTFHTYYKANNCKVSSLVLLTLGLGVSPAWKMNNRQQSPMRKCFAILYLCYLLLDCSQRICQQGRPSLLHLFQVHKVLSALPSHLHTLQVIWGFFGNTSCLEGPCDIFGKAIPDPRSHSSLSSVHMFLIIEWL